MGVYSLQLETHSVSVSVKVSSEPSFLESESASLSAASNHDAGWPENRRINIKLYWTVLFLNKPRFKDKHSLRGICESCSWIFSKLVQRSSFSAGNCGSNNTRVSITYSCGISSYIKIKEIKNLMMWTWWPVLGKLV